MNFLVLRRCKWWITGLILLSLQGIVSAQSSTQFSANPISGCAPLVVQFSDSSTGNITQWRWDLGNGVTSYLRNPSTTYFNPGTYTIKLITRTASGVDSVVKSQYITVYPNPAVSFKASDSLGCFPLPVQFTDNSTTASGIINNWSWDFGDGTLSALVHPSHTYKAAGNFSVTLNVTNSYGCTKTITKQQYIKISNGAKADFTNTASAQCKAPATIQFTNKSTGASAKYIWDFGDGTISDAVNPSHTYTINGTYTVRLMAISPQGCTDTLTKENLISVGTIKSNFTAPTVVCEGQSFTITNTTTPIPGSVLWQLGDGTVSDENAPQHVYQQAGNYTIKLLNNFGGCSDSVQKTITVVAKTKPDFSALQTLSCKAPFTVPFTNKTTGSNTYKWDFGDGATSTEIQPSHTYTRTGNFTVSLITFNENGCSDTLVQKDFIQIQKPVITISNLPATGCNPVTIKPTATVTANEAITGYIWSFGDGTTSTVTHPTHTYTKAGNYNVTLTIITASGCSDSVVWTNAVRVGDKPQAKLTAITTETCASDPIQFNDNSTGNVDQWLWEFGDNYTATQQNPSHVFDGVGKFSVSLTVWSNTCPDTVQIKDMVNIKPPLSLFSFTNSCSNKYQKVFTDQSVGATAWHWDFGDGTTSTERNPVHTYANTGTYKVVLNVSNGTCTNINWSMVNVVDEKASFVTDQKIVCRNATITFTTPDITAANIAHWQWNFGDGTTATNAATVSHVYTQSGAYKASLTITDILGCTSTKTYDIIVYGPVADFRSSTSGVCLNDNKTTFSDSSRSDGRNAIAKRIWNYGDGIYDSTNKAPFEHIYTQAGEYTITLKVIDNMGCADILSKPKAIIIAQPKANFISPDSLSCTNKPIRFINSSSGYDLKYQWIFGDGSAVDNSNMPMHHYGNIGLYDVQLKVTDRYGCTDSLTRPQYIDISLPKASFTLSDTLGTCPPLLVHFTNTSSNYVKLQWNFGDGNTSVLDTPSHYYTVPGIYYATLIVTGPGGCIDSIRKKIEVKGPKGSFTYNPTIGCKPLQSGFTATTTNRTSFVWDFSDGTTITTKDSIISHTYTEAGEYIPKMILTDANGCTVPIIGKDTIKVVGINAAFSASQFKLCDSGYVQFTNTTVSNDLITGYQWNFGDGHISTQASPTHQYKTIGAYMPQLIVRTQTGCTDTAIFTQKINVLEAPVVAVLGDSAACAPATLSFKAKVIKGDAHTLQWNWNLGNGQTSAIQNPVAQVYENDDEYVVNVMATNQYGCTDTATKKVHIHPVPQVDAGKDALVCRGSTIQLNATGAAQYIWKANSDLNCTDCALPVAKPVQDVVYTVTGYNAYGCSQTDSVKIKVRQPFTLNVNPGDTICAGDMIHLWATGADQYTWYPSVGLDNATIARPKAKPRTTTVYNVVAKDNDNCFTQTAKVTVKVHPIPKVEATDITVAAGSSAQLKTISSNDVVTWRWTPSAMLDCSSCAEPRVAPKQTTKYHVEVKNAGGCEASDDVTVSVICNNGNLFIPNTFTPNGDGVNDRFYPRGTGISLIRSLRIFNRWGEVVYERINFNANDASAGWDGTYKGQKLASDVYIYACEVVCMNNEVLMYKGDITLLK